MNHDNTLRTRCNFCAAEHRVTHDQLGDMLACQECGQRFLILPDADDVQELSEITHAERAPEHTAKDSELSQPKNGVGSPKNTASAEIAESDPPPRDEFNEFLNEVGKLPLVVKGVAGFVSTAMLGLACVGIWSLFASRPSTVIAGAQGSEAVASLPQNLANRLADSGNRADPSTDSGEFTEVVPGKANGLEQPKRDSSETGSTIAPVRKDDRRQRFAGEGTSFPTTGMNAHPNLEKLKGKWGKVLNDLPAAIEFLGDSQALVYVNCEPVAASYSQRGSLVYLNSEGVFDGTVRGKSDRQNGTFSQQSSITFTNSQGEQLKYFSNVKSPQEGDLAGRWVLPAYREKFDTLPDVMDFGENGELVYGNLNGDLERRGEYELQGSATLAISETLFVSYEFDDSEMVAHSLRAPELKVRYRRIASTVEHTDEPPPVIPKGDGFMPFDKALSLGYIEATADRFSNENEASFIMTVSRTPEFPRDKELRLRLEPGQMYYIDSKKENVRGLLGGNRSKITQRDVRTVVASIQRLPDDAPQSKLNELILTDLEPVKCRTVAYYFGMYPLVNVLQVNAERGGNLRAGPTNRLLERLVGARPLEVAHPSMQVAIAITCVIIARNSTEDSASWPNLTHQLINAKNRFGVLMQWKDGVSREVFDEGTALVAEVYEQAEYREPIPICVSLAQNPLYRKVLAAYENAETVRTIWRSGPTPDNPRLPRQTDARCELAYDLGAERARIVAMGFGEDQTLPQSGGLAVSDGRESIAARLLNGRLLANSPKTTEGEKRLFSYELVSTFGFTISQMQGVDLPVEVFWLGGESGAETWLQTQEHDGEQITLETVPPEPDDPKQRPGLRFHHFEKADTLTIWIDPDTFLIDEEVPDKKLNRQSTKPLNQQIRTLWKVHSRTLNETLPKSMFDMPTLLRKPPRDLLLKSTPD